MPKPGIRYYLIASLFMHAAVLLFFMTTAKASKVDVKVVEVFITDPSSVPQQVPQQSPRNAVKVTTRKPASEAGRPQAQAVPQKRDAPTTQAPSNMHQDNAEQIVAHAVESVKISTPAASAAHKPDMAQGALPVSSVSRESAAGRPIPASRQGAETVEEMKMGDAGAPRFIHRETPVYPFMARKLGKEGRVMLRLTLNENGGLMDIEVIANAGYGFTEAAILAVKKSVFSPARKDGKPVVSKVALPVRFVLRENGY